MQNNEKLNHYVNHSFFDFDIYLKMMSRCYYMCFYMLKYFHSAFREFFLFFSMYILNYASIFLIFSLNYASNFKKYSFNGHSCVRSKIRSGAIESWWVLLNKYSVWIYEPVLLLLILVFFLFYSFKKNKLVVLYWYFNMLLLAFSRFQTSLRTFLYVYRTFWYSDSQSTLAI